MRRKLEIRTQQLAWATGEVDKIQLKEVTVKTKTSEQFYMVYIECVAPLLKITSGNDAGVLSCLCTMMEYNTARVYLNADRRKEICDRIGIVNSVLSRSLASLRNLSLITGGEGGTYEINPYIFWKGNTADREKLLRNEGLTLKIKFKIDD